MPSDLLTESVIAIEYLICSRNHPPHYATERDALTVTIVDGRRPGAVRGNWEREWPIALIRPRLEWEHEGSNRRTADRALTDSGAR